MATLSERLNSAEDAETGPYRVLVESDVLQAAAVCAAVEAFQAAEQEVMEARVARDSERLWKANNEHGKAKARLLEVNLG
jgi:hypothetical protein